MVNFFSSKLRKRPFSTYLFSSTETAKPVFFSIDFILACFILILVDSENSGNGGNSSDERPFIRVEKAPD